MKENILFDKALAFGVRILRLSQLLEEQKQSIIAKQILRSGSSIGANISESEYAVSNADFINKLQIARKEANETRYWLLLLFEAKLLEEKLFNSISADLEVLIKILAVSVMTAKKKKD